VSRPACDTVALTLLSELVFSRATVPMVRSSVELLAVFGDKACSNSGRASSASFRLMRSLDCSWSMLRARSFRDSILFGRAGRFLSSVCIFDKVIVLLSSISLHLVLMCFKIASTGSFAGIDNSLSLLIRAAFSLFSRTLFAFINSVLHKLILPPSFKRL